MIARAHHRLAVAAALASALLALGPAAARTAHAQGSPRCTQMRFRAITDGAAAPAPQVVDVQCRTEPDVRTPLGVVSATLAAASVAGGVVFTVLAVNTTAQLNAAAMSIDPTTGLPLVRWSDVAALEDSRRAFTGAAIGLYVAGAAFGVGAVLLLALPRGAGAAASGPRASVTAGPGSLGLALRF